MIQVSIPTELEPFVDAAVRDGRFHDSAEVVSEALRLLARREQLFRDINAGVEQLGRGEYTEYEDNSLRAFLADIEAEEQARFPEAENRP